jgi:hypothetical protein
MPPASSRSAVSVDIHGPFFRADVEKTLFENIEKMMRGLAEEGAKAARFGLMTGSGSRALVTGTGGRVADRVIGRTRSLSGKRWYAAAVVQVDRSGLSGSDATSLMAAASYVESRTKAISRVSRSIRSSRAVLRANLSEGLE